jgi:hypothetical protein
MQGQLASDANGEQMRPHTKGLLRLTSAQKEKLEHALEKTWIAHVLVAGIGIAIVFNVGNVAESIIAHLLQGPYDLKTIATILLAVHVYYFMRTGPLLSAFGEAKSWHDYQLEGYFKGQEEAEKARADPLHPLSGTTSFLAAALYPRAKGYLIITTFVVSVAQAATLFLVFKAFRVGAGISLSSAFFVLVLVILITLYFMFWQRRYAGATVVVIVLVLILFFVFEMVAPGYRTNDSHSAPAWGSARCVPPAL